MYINFVDTTLIVLSALTVLFTLFLCFIAIIAFLGWTNFKDFKKKQEALLTQKRKALSEADASVEESKKEMREIIEDLKTKIKTPIELEEQTKKTEELIDKLNKAIHKAEEKVDNLRITETTSSPYTYMMGGGTSHFTPISSISDEKKCSNCGRIYYNDSILVLGSRCPYCGNLNY